VQIDKPGREVYFSRTCLNSAGQVSLHKRHTVGSDVFQRMCRSFSYSVPVLPLLLLAVIACGGGNSAATTSGSTTEPFPVSNPNDQAELAQAASALRSYRATISIELLPSRAMEKGTFEIILPDRSHFTITMGTMTNETIVIGSDRYARMGQSWSMLPPPPPGGGLPRVLTTTGALNQLAAFTTAAAAGNLIRGGADAVDGRPCQLYSHSIDTNTFEYCVAEGLPLRMIVMGTAANVTFIFADYNQVLDISAPN
jgi:hypothetical protein